MYGRYLDPKERAIRQAKMVIIIFCFSSTMSSGKAYTPAPILRAMEMAYL